MSTLWRESHTQGDPSIQLFMVAFPLVSSHILFFLIYLIGFSFPSSPQPNPEDLKPKQFMGMEIPFSDGQNQDRFMALFQVATVLDRPPLPMLPRLFSLFGVRASCSGV